MFLGLVGFDGDLAGERRSSEVVFLCDFAPLREDVFVTQRR